jgi:hypothetical protein
MATRKKHTPEQVVRKLATADRMLNDGKDVAEVCRELQVSEQTYSTRRPPPYHGGFALWERDTRQRLLPRFSRS